MNLRRVFASALVRRVAYVVAGATLAFFGVGRASAADSNTVVFGSQGDAYSSCVADLAEELAYRRSIDQTYNYASYPCTLTTPGTAQTDYMPFYLCRVYRTFSGSEFYCRKGAAYRYAYPVNSECSKKPPITMHSLPVTGSTQCLGGCVFTYAQNVDDTSTASATGAVCRPSDFKNNCPTGTHWNDYMVVCEPEVKECPPGQKESNGQCVPDGKCPEDMIAVPGSTPGAVQQGALYCKPAQNECPAGNVKSPTGQCLPGEGQCAVGEARRENGTCGKDKDGDGKADEDDDDSENDPKKDSASGGDTCETPPSCSGNAISCMQVKIQWRIDCNTRRQVNISGGTCSAVPICTGKGCNAMEYAQLMQQWRTACAVEKLASKTGEDGGPVGDANKNGVADVLEGTGNVSDPGDGKSDVDGAKRFGIGVSTDRLDKENIFGSGSCPEPPSFQIMGFSIANDFPYWCQAMAILRALVLMFGAFYALKILIGGVA